MSVYPKPELGPDVYGTHAAQLLQRAQLDLADTLAGDGEALADFFERVRVAIIEAEAHPHDIALTRGQLVHDPAWTQIMADVFGVPVTASKVFEASSRGAALLAFHSLGLIADLADVPTYLGRKYAPDAAHHAVYEKARARHEALYAKLIADEQPSVI